LKYVVLAVALLSIVPLGLLLRGKARALEHAAVLLGLSFWLPLVTVNLVSHETYRGADRGFEFTHVDLFAWALLFALPRPSRPMPFRKVQIFYFFACALTIFGSVVPLYTAFSLWKIVRMFVFVAVLWRLCGTPGRMVRLLDGLAIGLIFQAFYCLKLRYLDGHHQIAGVFSHQNSLGMAVNIVLPLQLARFMYTGSRLSGVAVACGCLCVIFSLSRGSLTMLLIGVSSVYWASMLRGVTGRKVFITLAGFVGAGAVLAKSFDTIVRRFESAPESSAGAREKFELVAQMMLAEHPMGVGMNMYSWEIRTDYGPRLGLPESEAGVAHHIYWLTVAECGYLGLLAYLLLLAVVFVPSVRAVVSGRRDFRGQLAMGCVAGLFVMYLQGSLEWIARQTAQSYLFWTVGVFGYALWRDVQRYPGRPREAEFGAFFETRRAS
jgi:hypothetical protein